MIYQTPYLAWLKVRQQINSECYGNCPVETANFECNGCQFCHYGVDEFLGCNLVPESCVLKSNIVHKVVGRAAKKMTWYLEFKVIEHKPKTEVYAVLSKSDNEIILGRVFWWPQWRQYVFEPREQTVWSRGCLQQVYEFIEKIMEARKK